MQPTRLVLVRHGQSTWNLERRLQGQTMDVPLTPQGLAEAELAAQRVAALVRPGTPVVSSDQLRARQTAEVVADGLGVAPRLTDLLREQALGSLEGRLAHELAEQPVPAGLDISEVAWGGGESIQQVHARCRRLLDWLAAQYPSAPALVLVSHGDTLRVLLAVLDGRGHRDVDWCVIGNGEVLVRDWADGGGPADGDSGGAR
ncbi:MULTISPECIES: histidine phosphatase family protein [unclassified Luteococcus]|uniref:histidine phosphatase family protein n=1 Tax=unclassified Luteococcus TaxID=2639923 RepID=UPI00313C9963